MTDIASIPARALNEPDNRKATILDVRTAMEHDEKRLGADHAHVPLDELKPSEFMAQQGLDKNATINLLCRSGKRAAQAAQKFIAEGFPNVRVIEGGIEACEQCGHKIEGLLAEKISACCAGAPLSLERQVRIAAGLLIASGAFLGLTVNSLFTFLPLFVGCGLIFAGVTDRCGLALLLTKAPWNKPRSAA